LDRVLVCLFAGTNVDERELRTFAARFHRHNMLVVLRPYLKLLLVIVSRAVTGDGSIFSMVAVKGSIGSALTLDYPAKFSHWFLIKIEHFLGWIVSFVTLHHYFHSEKRTGNIDVGVVLVVAVALSGAGTGIDWEAKILCIRSAGMDADGAKRAANI